jgi:hypothetical protein
MTKPFDIQLTAADRKKLLRAFRRAQDHLQLVQAHILLLLGNGLSVAEVQAVTFTEEAEVAKAVRLFREGGVAAVIQEG